MRQVCDLCGARWYPGDSKCRECGTPHDLIEGDAEPSNSAPLPEPDAPAPAPPAIEDMPEPGAPSSAAVTPSIALALSPHRGRSSLVGGLLLAVVAIGAAVVLYLRTPGPAPTPTTPEGTPTEAVANPEVEPQRPPIDPCEGIEALAGTWSFATRVTGATDLQYSGVKGFYELEVDVDGCSATGRVKKTGYSGAWYSDRHMLRAKAVLTKSPGAFEFGFAGLFELRSASGEGPDQEFVFVADGGELSGIWRQRGERWSLQGLSGYLAGEREPDSRIHPVLEEQPCEVRCAVSCDAARFEDLDAIDGCVADCNAEEPEIPTCGAPLPEDLRIGLEGPKRSLDGWCNRQTKGHRGKKNQPKFICEKSLLTQAGWAIALTGSKVGGGWEQVRFMQAGPADDADVRIALQIPEGWYVSEPLLTGTDRSNLVDAKLYARTLSGSDGRGNVFGFVAGETHRIFFACRLEESDPECVQIPTPPGETNPTSAPVGGVISSADEIKRGDIALAPGPYYW